MVSKTTGEVGLQCKVSEEGNSGGQAGRSRGWGTAALDSIKELVVREVERQGERNDVS